MDLQSPGRKTSHPRIDFIMDILASFAAAFALTAFGYAVAKVVAWIFL